MIPLKAVQSCIQTTSKRGNYLVSVMGLRCAQAHFILTVIFGDGKSKGDWLKKRTEKWESNVHALIKTSDKYFQKSYSTAAREVQLDWIFLQQVTK